MDPHLMMVLQPMIGILAGVMMTVALIMLWTKTQSGWLLFAMVGECVALLFRLSYAFVPSLIGTIPSFALIATLSGLVVAAGLMGYALEQPARRE